MVGLLIAMLWSSPVVQDLLVGPVGHQLLDGGEDGLLKTAVLGHRDSIWRIRDRGRRAELELAVRLLDRIVSHRGVGESRVDPAARERQVDAVLVGEGADRDRRLAGVRALLALRRRVIGFGGALLGADFEAADVVDRVDGGTAVGVDEERLARGRVGDEVDGLLTVLRVRERGHAEVVLSGVQSRDDAVERLVRHRRLQAHQLRDRLREIRVHADHGLAVGADVLIRGVGRVGGHAELAARLDVGGHLARDGRVLLDSERSRGQCPAAGAAVVVVVAAAARCHRDGGESDHCDQRGKSGSHVFSSP